MHCVLQSAGDKSALRVISNKTMAITLSTNVYRYSQIIILPYLQLVCLVADNTRCC